MSELVDISAEIPEELSLLVDRVAAATQRGRSTILEDALRFYVPQQLEFVESVEEGIKQMEAGEVVPHSEVVADMRRRLEQLHDS
jgi:predicted transcriptional regulator